MKAAAFFVVLLFLAGCAAPDSPADPGESSSSGTKQIPQKDASGKGPSDLKETGGLKYVFKVEQGEYQLDEVVVVSLSVVNESSKTIVCRFPSAQTHDFTIRDDRGREVWRWAEEKFFTQAFKELKLEPSEGFRVTESWDQQTIEGKTVKPGKYEVDAEFTAVDREQMMGPLSIEISK